jgi:two-component system, chemotaxis family, chemotaxis protein CheY
MKPVKCIIVADDSTTARMIIIRCLQIAGAASAQFLEAKDGKDALELARNSQADLLVTDLNMPNMDGRSLLKHIKASPKLASLPVLVISSASNDARKNEMHELGAFEVLCKPVSPADLAKVLEKLPQSQELIQ